MAGHKKWSEIRGSRRTIVVVGGYAGSGKDEFADRLVAGYGFEKVRFSDAITEVLCALNPVICLGPVPGTFWRFSDVVELNGIELAKKIPEVRQLMQRIGYEAGPRILGDDLWVKPVVGRVSKPGRWVITGCRHTEVEAPPIVKLGGHFVRITRPGTEPLNGHEGELAIDRYEWDETVANDGTIADLHAKADSVVQSLGVDARAE